ncbi:MAG: hypothetical protein OEV42_10955 [Deltaproteobacteria bacterium]|nr:hypothetical protein [Deltaproteobacteria bacterium]
MENKRNRAYWVITVFLALSALLLLMGQTMAIVNYDFAVQLGLQEDVTEVGEYGLQLNRAFGAADTLVYLPLILISLVGLFLRKRWSLTITAAVMGISAYWATTIVFMLFFLTGIPHYYLEPGIEYGLILGAYIIFGLWGMIYLAVRGERIVN